jgi:hypothetical protein
MRADQERCKPDTQAAANRKLTSITAAEFRRVKVAKPSKYGNKRTVVDGITFASKREAKRYGELKMFERTGVIRELKLQVPFDVVLNGTKVCRYIADFAYIDFKERYIVEDAKGKRTALYILKSKLMKAVLGIEIVEV